MALCLPVSFPFAHDVRQFFIGHETTFHIPEHFVKSKTLGRAHQSDATFDDFDDIVSRGSWLEFDGVEGAVHEIDASIDQTSAYGAKDLLR